MRLARGWSPDQWMMSRASLIARGLLSPDGLSADGARLLSAVEETTDDLAWQGGLLSVRVDEVVSALAPAAEAVWASGVLPEANPIGVSRP
jgi:hypothetical protein